MLSIYNFDDPIDFLGEFISKERASSSRFNLKEFSAELGLSSSVHLIDILKRKKKLKDKLAHKLIETIQMDDSEKMYFEAILAKSQTEIKEKMRMYDLIIQDLKPSNNSNFNPLYTNELNIFSNWIYTAILSLAEIEDFDFSVQNIKNKLIEDIGNAEIERALFELLSNGLLETSNGRIKVKYSRTTTKSAQSCKGVKQYYSAICDLAKRSFDLPIAKRETNTFSFAIDEKNIPLAKELIGKCRNNLSKLSEQGEPNQVYQASLMLFPLTK